MPLSLKIPSINIFQEPFSASQVKQTKCQWPSFTLISVIIFSPLRYITNLKSQDNNTLLYESRIF